MFEFSKFVCLEVCCEDEFSLFKNVVGIGEDDLDISRVDIIV